MLKHPNTLLYIEFGDNNEPCTAVLILKYASY